MDLLKLTTHKGERLVAFMEDTSLGQRAVAEELGVSQPTVHRMIGKKNMDVGLRPMFEFVRRFGYNPDWFFSDEAPRFIVEDMSVDQASMSLSQLTLQVIQLRRNYSDLLECYQALLKKMKVAEELGFFQGAQISE